MRPTLSLTPLSRALLIAALLPTQYALAAPVCFYENINYTGKSTCLSAVGSSNLAAEWNDYISSVTLEPGYSVTLYEHINAGGRTLTLTGSEPNLVARNFNDLASSVKLAVDTTPIKLSSIELAQTHVIPPEGRTLQSQNEAAKGTFRTLRLLENRAALLMVQPDAAQASLQVRARMADGRVLGPLTLAAPAQIPATSFGRAPYSTAKHSVLLPAEWIRLGTKLEVARPGFGAPVSVALTVVPAQTLTQTTIPIYLFGARPEKSVASMDLTSLNTNGYRFVDEYAEKLPINAFQQTFTAPLVFDQLVAPARNDDKYCYPAMAIDSWATWKAMEIDTNPRMLRTVADFHMETANRDGAMAHSYFGIMQVLEGGQQKLASVGGALAYVGGEAGVTGEDWAPGPIYSAVFNHEMGHAYGLGHADYEYSQGNYPYPKGTKSGSSWGFNRHYNELLNPRFPDPCQYNGKINPEDRTVNGVCYERTPMSGGDLDLEAGKFRWTWFSDYEAVLMQDHMLGRVFADASRAGGYKRWDASSAAFVDLSSEERARIGSDVLKQNQQVQTIVGSISHFNLSPTASKIYVMPAGIGNLPRQLDPTLQADMDLANTDKSGGWNGWYCYASGCDYTLVASYADGTVVRALLPFGYRQWGNGNISTTAKDVLHGDNLKTYAVNVPSGHGGVTRVQVYNTPMGSGWKPKLTALSAVELGSAKYPLVNEWTTANGYTGGNGASGSTQFNSSVCKAGAVVKRPAR